MTTMSMSKGQTVWMFADGLEFEDKPQWIQGTVVAVSQATDDQGPMVSVYFKQHGLTEDCLASWLTTADPAEPASWRSEEPTQKQVAYLKTLGHKDQLPATRGEASDLIDRLQPSCHYCGGQPATGFGFFNEPVCRQCGGR